jgi:hypothetical protein
MRSTKKCCTPVCHLPLSLLIANGQASLILLIGMFQAEKSWHVFNLQDLVIYVFTVLLGFKMELCRIRFRYFYFYFSLILLYHMPHLNLVCFVLKKYLVVSNICRIIHTYFYLKMSIVFFSLNRFPEHLQIY